MSVIDILIPIAPNRFLPQVVLDHLLVQGYPLRFFISNVVGDSASKARESVKQMWQNSEPSAPYCLMIDNDIILNPGTLDVMIRFLENNQNFVALALQKGEDPIGRITEAIEPQDIPLAPVLYKSKIYKQIPYFKEIEHSKQPEEENQQKQPEPDPTKQIRDLGYKIGLLCGVTYQYIQDTSKTDL